MDGPADSHLPVDGPSDAQNDAGNLDGSFDSGLPDGGVCVPGSTRPCYTGPASKAGLGICKRGKQTCLANYQWPTDALCPGEVLPGTESCNGLDDDCNGEVDDESIYGSKTCGVGACTKTVNRCHLDPNSRMYVVNDDCTPFPPGVEVCNNVDDDCNGVVDDNPTPPTCGIGACTRTGTCVNHKPVCTPGMPTTSCATVSMTTATARSTTRSSRPHAASGPACGLRACA